MDPAGAGRVRGFRAPSADPTPPAEAAAGDPVLTETAGPAEASAPTETSAQAETLEIGRPGRARRPRRLTGARWKVGGGRFVLAAAALLLVAIVIIAGLAFKLGSVSASSDRPSVTPTPSGAKTPTPLPVTDLYRQVVPSVVLITTSKGSLGSGTIVTDTGTVLTAYHVISGGGSISILFADGTKSAATVAATSPKTDIATLTPKKLPEVVVAATLGGGVAVGSDVVAIGNPLGLRDSTTTGVVSGLNRTSTTKTGKAGKTTSLSGLIQFDAAVNPGSSGGPLLNEQALVVGVVVSIADPGRDDAFAGIGFAVPIGAALGGGGDGPGSGGGPQL